MPFSIVRQDITKIKADAVVNAANSKLNMGGGVCGAIFNAAGAEKLKVACDKVAPVETGGAAITPGFGLSAKYIIHAVGPKYSHWSEEQNEIYLRSAYRKSLELAKENNCTSIAFPLISSGIYGYPKDKALKVATDTIRCFLLENEMNVYLTVFDRESFQISYEVLGSVESYIDEHYVDTHYCKRRKIDSIESMPIVYEQIKQSAPVPQVSNNFDNLLNNLDESFSDFLMKLIDKKGKTDVEVYKKANIDRKLFSKIRTGKGYMPSKRTILALSVALELTLDETDDLLERGGYALSHSQKFDVIVEYFIVSGKHDIYKINEVLFKYDQPLLGG